MTAGRLKPSNAIRGSVVVVVVMVKEGGVEYNSRWTGITLFNASGVWEQGREGESGGGVSPISGFSSRNGDYHQRSLEFRERAKILS